MKRELLIAVAFTISFNAFGQGQVNFNNRYLVTPGFSGAQANIYAPVYGLEPGNPSLSLQGQNAVGIPQGYTVYHGAPLSGTGFTAQLWGGPSADSLLPALSPGTVDGFATTTFRTSAATAGSVVTLIYGGLLQNTPGGEGTRGFLQLLAWDNQGGTVSSWAQVMANPNIARGESPVFSPPFDLGGGPTIPPNLIGLQSFNLFIVPEPSPIALGALGLGALFLRRRKA